MRFNRDCELSFPIIKFDKLSKQKGEFLNQITKYKTRARRLRKQRRLFLKKIRNLNNYKARNILKLKVNKIIIDTTKKIILLKTLNSPSPRSFSFTDLTVKEKFTNLFFKLLNSFNKNVEMS
jgi:hypothetical protein